MYLGLISVFYLTLSRNKLQTGSLWKSHHLEAGKLQGKHHSVISVGIFHMIVIDQELG